MRRIWPLIFAVACAACTREPAPGSEPPKEGSEAMHSPAEFAEKADIQIYPGATFPANSSNIRQDTLETRYEIIMVTKDEAKKVQEFYKKSLTKPDLMGDTLMGLTPKQNFVMINTEKAPAGTKIKAVVVESKVDFKGQK